MWRGIGNEHDHLACVFSPIHVESLSKRRRDRLWPITAPRGVQRGKILVNLANV